MAPIIKDNRATELVTAPCANHIPAPDTAAVSYSADTLAMKRKAARLEAARKPARDPEKAPKQEQTHEQRINEISRGQGPQQERGRDHDGPSLGMGR
jgi:hypothetical protein